MVQTLAKIQSVLFLEMFSYHSERSPGRGWRFYWWKEKFANWAPPYSPGSPSTSSCHLLYYFLRFFSRVSGGSLHKGSIWLAGLTMKERNVIFLPVVSLLDNGNQAIQQLVWLLVWPRVGVFHGHCCYCDETFCTQESPLLQAIWYLNSSGNITSAILAHP